MSQPTPDHSSVTEWRMQELMARLDERTQSIQRELGELRKEMVTQAELKPLRMAVYGFIALICTGVIGAILSLVVQR